MNKQYLEALRSRSCYPTFRTFIAIATVLTYLLAAVAAIVGFASKQAVGIAVGIGAALLLVLLAKVAEEVSLMVADIADVTIDAAAAKDTARPAAENNAGTASASPATDASASSARSRERPRSGPPIGPQGTCPNCQALISLTSLDCAMCKASFGPGSAWSVKPLS